MDIVEGKGKMKDASYFLARTQPMKSRGLLFTIALPDSFFNLYYLKFFSSMFYSFQSAGLSPHWLNLLKSLLMKVKVESEKVGLKLNIQKMKIMAWRAVIHGVSKSRT